MNYANYCLASSLILETKTENISKSLIRIPPMCDAG